MLESIARLVALSSSSTAIESLRCLAFRQNQSKLFEHFFANGEVLFVYSPAVS